MEYLPTISQKESSIKLLITKKKKKKRFKYIQINEWIQDIHDRGKADKIRFRAREREKMKVPGESGRETSSEEVVAEKRESMHLQEVVED